MNASIWSADSNSVGGRRSRGWANDVLVERQTPGVLALRVRPRRRRGRLLSAVTGSQL